MQDIEVNRFIGDIGATAEPKKDTLEVSERAVRITIMTAFVTMLAGEAWLVWQVIQAL